VKCSVEVMKKEEEFWVGFRGTGNEERREEEIFKICTLEENAFALA
jgi:hypothetical protein